MAGCRTFFKHPPPRHPGRWPPVAQRGSVLATNPSPAHQLDHLRIVWVDHMPNWVWRADARVPGTTIIYVDATLNDHDRGLAVDDALQWVLTRRHLRLVT